MPVERISQSFKDLSPTLKVNPITGDLVALKNSNAIARSLKNLVFTDQGERFFAPETGGNVKALLFDNMDSLVASRVEDSITQTIAFNEPRVELISVKATPNFDYNEIDVRIQYTIIGLELEPQQLEFALQPTR